MKDLYPEQPSLKNLNQLDLGVPRSEPNAALESLGAPHVESFNYMLEDGLRWAVADLRPVEFKIPITDGPRVKIWISECNIAQPRIPSSNLGAKENRIFPTEARQTGGSYKGQCTIRYIS